MCYIASPIENIEINQAIAQIIAENVLTSDMQSLAMKHLFSKNPSKVIPFLLNLMKLDENTLQSWKRTEIKYKFLLWKVSKIGEKPQEEFEFEEDEDPTTFEMDEVHKNT
jgi:hypothetical protein